MKWRKRSAEDIRSTVFKALEENRDFSQETVLGIPASYLDGRVFNRDNEILKNAPFLTALVNNPNHIGCHTLTGSESFFSGTQKIEKEVIAICAEDIMKSNQDEYDGYVASGGTEANIQAIWIYRNYFIQEFGAKHDEIAVICSSDSHYSMIKASNLLNINYLSISVDDKRKINEYSLEEQILAAKGRGIKYVICVVNMMTTMFGSVDNPELYASILDRNDFKYKIHVDAAFGGFYYPFSNESNSLNFQNPLVSSITMDAHKMAQAPYGTGIFLIRKGYMKYAHTKEASYVKGEDSTLIGSRSGANAISIWMILSHYGSFGWQEKIFILQKRTNWLCSQLDELNIAYYREQFSNIVTIDANVIDEELAIKYGLVPDNHDAPKWYKVVVMDHVEIEHLQAMLDSLIVSAAY